MPIYFNIVIIKMDFMTLPPAVPNVLVSRRIEAPYVWDGMCTFLVTGAGPHDFLVLHYFCNACCFLNIQIITK